ncbi:MAG: Gfo/Idh/MocA family oxidoreductase [Bryobacterales bacterium]|nr:Gfo/Idh/MocA family oxidoreductase [Bryobacterales bacterium]
MGTRRVFLGSIATGFAALQGAPGGRLRLGIIGAGSRGVGLMKDALACPNVEFAGVADIYTRRLEAAKTIAPAAKTYLDYRYLLEDSSIDAVIVATPQHLHCEHFTASLSAGKHVYQEKTMAFTVAHAKRMREAYRKAGKVVQVGHQSLSSGMMPDARKFLKEEPMGKVTAIHMTMYRNTPHGQPQWSRKIDPSMTPENIIWKSFLGDNSDRPFDANQYINWRFFWDYSGGNVYENMCHQIAFWYGAMDLKIPTTVAMNGGIYLWKDGRQVPDTMCVSLEQPEEMLISWNSGFGNDYLQSAENVLGTDGTITKNDTGVTYSPQKVNTRDRAEKSLATRTPSYAHMLNFVDCIRNGGQPTCPFEIGFRVSIACRMAVDSYRRKKPVRWDAVNEDILA